MATPETATDFTLKLNRAFNAPCEKVFKAWTDADALRQWFAPSSDFTTKVTELDVRKGGRYRIEMHAPDGNTHTVLGQYLEVVPSKKIVMTWAWENSDPPDEMLVTVEFVDKGGKTELAVTHERLPSQESRDLHDEGWTGCLGRLVELMNS